MFVDEYPTTASGKIQKYKLREMATQKLGREDAVVETA
jgi:fatty-acyl-CoA synthase